MNADPRQALATPAEATEAPESGPVDLAVLQERFIKAGAELACRSNRDQILHHQYGRNTGSHQLWRKTAKRVSWALFGCFTAGEEDQPQLLFMAPPIICQHMPQHGRKSISGDRFRFAFHVSHIKDRCFGMLVRGRCMAPVGHNVENVSALS